MSYSPPPLHAKWELPADPDLAAAIKMLSADDDDDAEACLDDAGRSHEGDEFETSAEPRERCTEAEDLATIITGMDAALIDYAHRTIYDDPVWTQLYAVRQALIETL